MNKKLNISKLSFLLFNNLSNKRKRQLFYLFFLMIISSIAELLTLGIALPFMGALVNPDILWDFIFLKNLFSFFQINSSSELIFPITFLFGSIVLISTSIRLLNVFFNGRLAAAIGSDMSCEAFKKTLNESYYYHTNTNTSELISTITTNTEVTVSVISSLLQLVTSIFILIGLLSGIILVNWEIAFYAFLILGSSYYLSIKYSRKRLNYNSQILVKNTKKQLQTLQESLGGIRDIILQNTQNYFTNKYRKYDLPLRMKRVDNQFLALYPRYSTEAAALLAIAVTGYFLVNGSKNSAFIIPTIGAIALGGQRLLPILQLIYSSWASVRGNLGPVFEVLKIINKTTKRYFPNEKGGNLNFKNKIIFKNISFSYNKNEKKIIDSVNFTIKKGDKVGLIGKTGSGKTTLIDIFIGLLLPTSGEVFIDDHNLIENISEWRNAIAYVPQNIFLSDSSIAENIAFGIDPNFIDFKKLKKSARMAQISDFIESLPKGYRTFVGERGAKLSGGQLQRIGIARALYKGKSVIVLDEATSALDENTEKKLMQTINNLGDDTTLIMITHRLSTIKKCSKVFELKDGFINEINY